MKFLANCNSDIGVILEFFRGRKVSDYAEKVIATVKSQEEQISLRQYKVLMKEYLIHQWYKPRSFANALLLAKSKGFENAKIVNINAMRTDLSKVCYYQLVLTSKGLKVNFVEKIKSGNTAVRTECRISPLLADVSPIWIVLDI